VAGQIRMSQRVPLVSPVALAVGEILQDRRNRVLLASSGSQMRAASVVPSFNGINVWSMTRTVRGNVVTIAGTLQFFWIFSMRTITMPAMPRLTSRPEIKNRQPLLSVNDCPRNHGTVQCNPTQARQIDIPVMPPDSEP